MSAQLAQALLASLDGDGRRVLAEGLLPDLERLLADRAAPAQHREWLDTAQAANYLGLHPGWVRKLAAEGSLPSEQDGPKCRRWFRRGDLDRWRESGGTQGPLAGRR